MFQLSNELQGLIYQFDSTFHQVFKAILKDLMKWRREFTYISRARRGIFYEAKKQPMVKETIRRHLIYCDYLKKESKWRLYFIIARCSDPDFDPQSDERSCCRLCHRRVPHEFVGYEVEATFELHVDPDSYDSTPGDDGWQNYYGHLHVQGFYNSILWNEGILRQPRRPPTRKPKYLIKMETNKTKIRKRRKK